MRRITGLLAILLGGCMAQWNTPPDFFGAPINAGDYQIMTYQKNSDSSSPVHIYIEGDGYAFDAYGQPTRNPTPRNTMLRDMAAADAAPNVVYLARPCQYVMSDACNVADWTNGRFSQKIIDTMTVAIKSVANGRDIILIGYSGGAMISGIIINQNPDINVKHWVTIAGVLNHADWTEYFQDMPLDTSINMDTLPQISQAHFVAEHDKIVPYELSRRWTGGKNMVVIKNARHDNFMGLNLGFDSY